ncbi:antiviral RADAR system adenosine deaminase RdrB [Pseudoalteromonas sp. SS15]|uniref:antiviral RADAR system adenosine deaminase RdrB n=1 Tax=Pseudoalteromonas sp. SS15 TaxID=3139393 RepID=UPI003BAC19EF
MFVVSDTHISDITFLTSDKALEQLAKDDVLGKAFFKRFQTYPFDYEIFCNRKLRNEDVVNQLLAFGYDKQPSVQDVLSRLANTFLEWQGCHFEVKPNKLEQWLQLLSLIDGSWIIAQAYCDLENGHGFSSKEVIDCIVNNQCPHALAKDRLTQPFADNHVHLGGHGHTGPSMLSFALYCQSLTADGWPNRAENTLFESGVYKKQDLPASVSLLANRLVESAFSKPCDKPLSFTNINVTAKECQAFFYLKTNSAHSLSQKAYLASHCKPVRSDIRWVLFCLGVLANFKSTSKMTSQFVRSSNILRNYMIVWGTGLGQFVESFGFRARKKRDLNKQDNPMDDGLVADIDSKTYREFRISPGLIVHDKGYANPNKLHKALESAFKHSLTENIHFVAHFSRSLKGDLAKREDKYQKVFRANLKKQVRALQQFHGSVSFSQQELSDYKLGKKLSESQTIDLRKAIRGYDVAGNENELSIEVFAPALRALRAAKHPSNHFTKRHQRPFLTIHSGEDYSHLLSGLRAIDEAVLFCDFKSGDRLGHALALGVMPEQWAQRQGTAYVTLGDHLDNLVWCYQKALEVIQKAPEFTGVLHLLQEKIDFWSLKLYVNSKYSPRELFEAWKLRRNCPETLNLNANDTGTPAVHPFESGYQEWVVDFTEVNKTHLASDVFELWRKYILAGTLENAHFERRKTPVIVNCLPQYSEVPFGIEEGRYYDSVSAAELELYEAIQDFQMEKYAAQEIIIEACPTSNIYIGRFEHYYEHPIFRWDPPDQNWLDKGEKFNNYGLRRGSVTVCVNTDDAALMPTTIENEHRVLKNMAISHYEVGANKAEDWIDKVRQRGVDIFKRNHLSWLNN